MANENVPAAGTTATAKDAPAGAATTPAAPVTKPAEGTILTAPPVDAKAGDKTTDKKADAAKAPTAYELKLPEGSLLDESAVERTVSYAKERGLTNEQAQAILEREHGAVASYVEAQTKALQTKATAWVAEIKADKEIGGEKFNENVELAKRVIQKHAPENLKKVLNETGLGNHPDLVRMLVSIAKGGAEDKMVIPGAQPAGKPKSTAEILFPPEKLEVAVVTE